MDSLKDFFERVYVINLKRRPDRLWALRNAMERCKWPFREPIIYPAIDGDKVGVPVEFTQGGGAYGCRMSHLRILQDCLMDDVQSVLILEDDADILEDFPERVREFLEKVPDDWEGIMLGGQHHAPPIPTDIPGVVRVRYAQRTHAYAARPSYMKALQRRWGNGTVHIDWMMRDWQHLQVVYAPEVWLIGQAGGRSDIRGAEKPPEWWIQRSAALPPGPVAIAFVSRGVMDALRQIGFHGGASRDANGMDVGLARMFATRTLPEHPDASTAEALRKWIAMIQSESVGGLLPTLWFSEDWWQCPDAESRLMALAAKAWNGPVYAVYGDSAEEAFACLPKDVQQAMLSRQTLRRPPVVLLRCPPSMIASLHSHGFHPGFWRDRESGYDMGLKRIFEETPPHERLDELRKWCQLLCSQADRDGLIVTAVHPKLTAEMLRTATQREVIEIKVEDIDELKLIIVGAK